MFTSTTPVAILGAGLTGMAAAHALGRAGVGYRLFERLDRPGGHAITTEDSGFRFDRTGHLLHLRHAETRALVLQWIGDDFLELERRSRIWSNGVYTRYPFQANTYGLPPAVAKECLLGFLEAHFRPDAEKKGAKNFEEYCLAHFGPGISRHFMIPYNARLWGVHPREISVDWCERFVPRPSLEDVVAGAVGLNDRELGYNTRFVYPRLGIGVLAEGLARALGDGAHGAQGEQGRPRIELGRAPRRIDWKKREITFDDETVHYDRLVSSVPLPVLVGLLVDAPPEVREAAARLRCTHLWYLDVAVRHPARKDLHWVYVPEDRYPFYRVGSYSNFSAALAPPGKSSLYVELADRSEPDVATLLPRVAQGLVEMDLLEAPGAIEFARARRIDYAYVVFDDHYFRSLETITTFLEEQGLVSAGRYGGWNYSSMEDALRFGAAAAKQVTTSP